VRLIAAVLGLAGAGVAASAGAAPQAAEVPVSKLPGAQVEPAIAVDPRDSRILVAGSNSFREGSMRVYSSVDGGAHWTAGFVYPRPTTHRQTCASDPGVAIDRAGRQYFSFVRTTPCRTGHPQLYVAARHGPHAGWRTPVLVSPLRGAVADDKPAIAVDTSSSSPYRGRVYVAWSRLSHSQSFDVVLSWSADGGRNWSRPTAVSPLDGQNTYASVAVSNTGTVYVAWDDTSTYSLKIARSTDGGVHVGRERQAASFSIVPIPHCGSGTVIAAQIFTCVHANPIVVVDQSRGPRQGRVYVSYARTNVTGVEGIFVTAFDSRLRLLSGSATSPPKRPVAPSAVATDRFWPQSAVDPSNGALWICFYDTRGDAARRRVFFSCTASTDGGKTWRRLVRAASVASDETQAGADPRQYGDYEGLAVANGLAHPIWTDSRDLAKLGEEIYTARLTLEDLG
jgi:hypothetical protein